MGGWVSMQLLAQSVTVGSFGMTRRVDVGNERPVQEAKAIPDGRFHRGDVVDELKPVKTRRKDRRAGAVAGEDQGVAADQVGKNAIGTAAGKCLPQDKYVAAANPQSSDVVQAINIIGPSEVEFFGFQPQRPQIIQFSLHTRSTDLIGGEIQCVADDGDG